MLKNIPKNRLLLYLLLLGLLPIVFVFFLFTSEKKALSFLEEKIEEVELLAISKEKKQSVNAAVLSHFRDADHFYIDKHLETLSFLEAEIESLQSVLEKKGFIEDELIKKRLDFLTGPANALAFSEGTVQTYPLFQETTESLVHPVEVNAADIQKILAKVEGLQIGPFEAGRERPQLIVLDFKLERKNSFEKSEVFFLNMKLLKREFL